MKRARDEDGDAAAHPGKVPCIEQTEGALVALPEELWIKIARCLYAGDQLILRATSKRFAIIGATAILDDMDTEEWFGQRTNSCVAYFLWRSKLYSLYMVPSYDRFSLSIGTFTPAPIGWTISSRSDAHIEIPYPRELHYCSMCGRRFFNGVVHNGKCYHSDECHRKARDKFLRALHQFYEPDAGEYYYEVDGPTDVRVVTHV